MMTSPMRPIAWESEDIMLMAPRSCNTSSAAIVSARDARFGEREVLRNLRIQVMTHHQHVQMLVHVFTVNGIVGLVDDGSNSARRTPG